MLTGDKIETATNIAVSARLIALNQDIYTISNLTEKSRPFSCSFSIPFFALEPCSLP